MALGRMEKGNVVEETHLEEKLHFGMKRNGCALADGRITLLHMKL